MDVHHAGYNNNFSAGANANEFESHTLFVDSSRRDLSRNPDPQEVAVEFLDPFNMVVGFEILDASIPNVMYTVEEHNNTFSMLMADDKQFLVSPQHAHRVAFLVFNLSLSAKKHVSLERENCTFAHRFAFVEPASTLDGRTIVGNGHAIAHGGGEPSPPSSSSSFSFVNDLSIQNINDGVAQGEVHGTAYLEVPVDATVTNITTTRRNPNTRDTGDANTARGAAAVTLETGDCTFMLEFARPEDEDSFTSDPSAFVVNPHTNVLYRMERVTCPDCIQAIGGDELYIYMRMDVRAEWGNYTVGSLCCHLNSLLAPAASVTAASCNGDFERTSKLMLQSASPFIVNTSSTTMTKQTGFANVTTGCTSVIKLSGRAMPLSFQCSDSVWRMPSPGVCDLTGERYVILRCPELENNGCSLYRTRTYSGVAVLKLASGPNSISELRFDYHSLRPSFLHPIGRVNRLTFRFECGDGRPYDFKGVDFQFLAAVKTLVVPRIQRFGYSILNPHYNNNSGGGAGGDMAPEEEDGRGGIMEVNESDRFAHGFADAVDDLEDDPVMDDRVAATDEKYEIDEIDEIDGFPSDEADDDHGADDDLQERLRISRLQTRQLYNEYYAYDGDQS